MSTTFFVLSQSKQTKLNQLFSSRLRLVIFALILEVLILTLFMRTFLFIVGLFNLPAIFALLACVLRNKLSDHQFQHTTKILLKVGIAKAFGGILLAIYMGLKYLSMLHVPDTNSKAMITLSAAYLVGSACVDIVYSLIAFLVIKRTRSITRILRRSTFAFSRSSSTSSNSSNSSNRSSCSSTNSTSCSEDEVSDEKESQSSL